MSFTKGFEKTAKANPFASATTKFIKDVARGVKDAGSETFADTLKLKGLRHATEAAKRHGGIGTVLRTEKGRADFAHGLGKAAPALATAALYGAAAKKIHNAIQESKAKYNQQYHTYYGG